MRIESGPAATDRNWQAVRTLIFLALAAYFVYDGAVGYPQAVRKAALQTMPGQFKTAPNYDSLPERPDKNDFDVLQKSLDEMVKKNQPITIETLRDTLGAPLESEPNPDGSGGRILKFASKFGMAKAIVDKGERIYIPAQHLIWSNWASDYTRDKIMQQFYLAPIPGVLGLLFLWKFFRAATLRVTVDDEGLIHAGKRIPFDDMVALRDYSPKGWIDLFYRDGASIERRQRLDNEKVLLFDNVVEAICQRKGFENLVKAHAAAQALAAEDEDVEHEEHEDPANDPDGSGKPQSGSKS